MDKPPIWQVSMEVPACLEEAATELLGRVLEQSTSAYRPLEGEYAIVSTFIEDRTRWNIQKAKALRNQILHFFPDACGKNVPKIRCRKIKALDWNESWKRHFKPIQIGRQLLIRPSWSRRKALKGQQLVVIDPGLSFGTGQHATTRFCLEHVVRLRESARSQSLLDIGTGSGILAIAAAKMGFTPVKAFDFDSDAVKITRENAAINGVLERTRITRSDLARLKAKPGRRHDVVCANLTHDLLKDHSEKIIGRVQAGGHLILAGILKEQFPGVLRCFQELNCQLTQYQEEKEWKSGTFCFKG
jgi:ribosomal protein L11 methyltransferase